MPQGQATTNFTDAGSAGVDLGVKYVTKDYLMTYYPGLTTAMTAPALWTCGYNNFGTLGQGTSGAATDTSVLGLTASGGQNWRSIGGSQYSMSAIKTDGTLWTWGLGSSGQLGTGSTASTASPGTVAGGGTTWQSVGTVFTAWSAAIKTDGTLWTWGLGTNGVLGNGSTAATSSPGTVAGGGTTWRQVAGGNHGAAVKTDGTLWTWGQGTSGQLGNGSTAATSSPGTVAGGGTTWRSVTCGVNFTSAIKTDGTLWTWGLGSSGQLGNGSTANTSSPVTTAGGGTTWSSVVNGGLHVLAIKTDGTLWTWGRGTEGQLGNSIAGNTSSPGTVAGGGTTWKQIAGGNLHTVAVKTDGTLWTWGASTKGQLGNGTTTNTSSPGTTTLGGTAWKSVSATFLTTTAIAEAQGY